MNTNLIATLSLVLFTNWTGFRDGNRELGVLATNHVATIHYAGATNQFTLKTTYSNIGAWRTNESVIYIFHDVIPTNVVFYTNWFENRPL